MAVQDAEARMDLLRQRAGTSDSSEKKGKRRKDDDDMKLIASSSSMRVAALPTTNGHINLFEDLEHVCHLTTLVFMVHNSVIDSESNRCCHTSHKKVVHCRDRQGCCSGSSA